MNYTGDVEITLKVNQHISAADKGEFDKEVEKQIENIKLRFPNIGICSISCNANGKYYMTNKELISAVRFMLDGTGSCDKCLIKDSCSGRHLDRDECDELKGCCEDTMYMYHNCMETGAETVVYELVKRYEDLLQRNTCESELSKYCK